MKKAEFIINVALIVILFLVFSLYMWVQHKNIFLKKDLKEARQLLTESEHASRHLEKLEKQSNEILKKEAFIQRKMPVNEIQPLGLMKTIILLCSELGLKNYSLKQIEKLAPVSQAGMYARQDVSDYQKQDTYNEMPKDVTGQEDALGEQQAIVVSNGIRTIFLELNFQGTYQQLLDFLKRLNGIERIVSVEGLNIERKKELLPYQKIQLILAAYTYSE